MPSVPGVTDPLLDVAPDAALPGDRALGRSILKGMSVRVAAMVLLAIVAVAVLAPVLATHDPSLIDPGVRLRSPSAEYLMGTDALGRDVFSRTVYGARVSLAVGAGVALLSVALGLLIGLVAGFFP